MDATRRPRKCCTDPSGPLASGPLASGLLSRGPLARGPLSSGRLTSRPLSHFATATNVSMKAILSANNRRKQAEPLCGSVESTQRRASNTSSASSTSLRKGSSTREGSSPRESALFALAARERFARIVSHIRTVMKMNVYCLNLTLLTRDSICVLHALTKTAVQL